MATVIIILTKATWLGIDEAHVCHLSSLGTDGAGRQVNERKEVGAHEAVAYPAGSRVTAHCPILEHASVTHRVNGSIPCELSVSRQLHPSAH